MIKSFFKILNHKEKISFFILSFLLIICSILEMFGIGLIPLLVSTYFSPQNIPDLFINSLSFFEINKNYSFYVSALILLIFTLKNFFLVIIYYFQGKYLTKLSQDIKQRLFNFYLNQNYIFHLNNSTNKIARNVLIETQSVRIFSYTLLQLIKESVVLVGIVILLLITNLFISTLILVLFSTIAYLFFIFFKKKLDYKSKEQQEIRLSLLKNISEIFGSIKDILIFSKQKLAFKFFKYKDDVYENNIFFQDVILKLPKIILELASIITIVGVLYYLESTNFDKDKIFSLITLISVCVIRMVPGYNIISGSLSKIKFISHSIMLISNILKKEILTKKKFKKIPLKGVISFKNVCFKYPNTKKNIINNLNLEIPCGSRVLIKGPSGSGKSTFLNIISGLIHIDKGKMMVNDLEINKNVYNWYENVSYVSQDIFLLDDTIKNNIVLNLNNSKINKQLYKKALEKSCLKNFIDKLVNKDKSIVGERSVRISGGQKQRIAIARAIYRNTNLIILDECTNGLDKNIERKILNYFLNLNRNQTVLVSSHHNLSKKYFDFIIHFKNNGIEASKIKS